MWSLTERGGRSMGLSRSECGLHSLSWRLSARGTSAIGTGRLRCIAVECRRTRRQWDAPSQRAGSLSIEALGSCTVPSSSVASTVARGIREGQRGDEKCAARARRNSPSFERTIDQGRCGARTFPSWTIAKLPASSHTIGGPSPSTVCNDHLRKLLDGAARSAARRSRPLWSHPVARSAAPSAARVWSQRPSARGADRGRPGPLAARVHAA